MAKVNANLYDFLQNHETWMYYDTARKEIVAYVYVWFFNLEELVEILGEYHFEEVINIGAIRKVEREVLRRRYGNKALAKAYRGNSFKAGNNYIPHKKMLTRKGRAILNGLIVIAAVVVLMVLIK